jgi:hypothetical protein
MSIEMIISLGIPMLAVAFTYGQLNNRVGKLENDVKNVKTDIGELRKEVKQDIHVLEGKLTHQIQSLDNKFSQLLIVMVSQKMGNQISTKIIKEIEAEYKLEKEGKFK